MNTKQLVEKWRKQAQSWGEKGDIWSKGCCYGMLDAAAQLEDFAADAAREGVTEPRFIEGYGWTNPRPDAGNGDAGMIPTLEQGLRAWHYAVNKGLNITGDQVRELLTAALTEKST